MKKIKNSLALIVSLTIALSALTSCDFLNNETYAEVDLIGTWNIDDASATAKVLGIDLVSVMTSPPFNLALDTAQMKFDTIASGFLETMAGTMTFNDDNTYSLDFTGLEEEIGTWIMDEETGDLSLTKDGEGETAQVYEIQTLDATDMIVDSPAQDIELDLNNDETPETSVKLVIVLELSKNDM